MRALLVLAFALAQEGRASPDRASAGEAERVARLELEAAKAKGFYFVAQAADSTLVLKLGGVPLASYRIESMELGVPLTSYRSSRDEAFEDLAPLALYECTSPPRPPIEIVPGPPPAPADAHAEGNVLPDVPRSVVLTCDPPLAVHLSSSSTVLGLRERLRLAGDRKGELRIRLVIAEPDAEKLLASVPRNVRFLLSRVPENLAASAESPR